MLQTVSHTFLQQTNKDKPHILEISISIEQTKAGHKYGSHKNYLTLQERFQVADRICNGFFSTSRYVELNLAVA